MIPITDEQRQAVEQAAAAPVRLTDPASRREYVLLPAEAYEKLRRLLHAEEIDPSFYEFEDIKEEHV